MSRVSVAVLGTVALCACVAGEVGVPRRSLDVSVQMRGAPEPEAGHARRGGDAVVHRDADEEVAGPSPSAETLECPRGTRVGSTDDAAWCELPDGSRHGPTRGTWPGGGIRFTGQWDHGKRTGTWEKWYRDGTPEQSGAYKDGKADGTWQTWTEEGVRKVVVYDAGVVVPQAGARKEPDASREKGKPREKEKEKEKQKEQEAEPPPSNRALD